ncbi:hypothetical protein ScPMuIL_005936 [Solemya velum]
MRCLHFPPFDIHQHCMSPFVRIGYESVSLGPAESSISTFSSRIIGNSVYCNSKVHDRGKHSNRERKNSEQMNKHKCLRRRDFQIYIPGCFLQSVDYQHETIYRDLLRTLLHPLGKPDTSLGVRPGDLLDHLKEVFDIDRDDHEFFIREEILHKPKHLQVNLNIVEGQGFHKPADSKKDWSPFCLLSTVRPNRSRGSPKTSPKNSPKASPKVRKIHNSPSIDQGDVVRTQSSQRCESPKWNEEFQLPVEDFLSDEIHVFVCDADADVYNAEQRLTMPVVESSRHHGLKNLFRMIRQMPDQDKGCGCLGKIIIPVRDIPVCGAEGWFDVVSFCSPGSKTKVVGQCHLRLDISYGHEEYESGEYISIEDYYEAAQQIASYVLLKSKLSGSQEGTLPLQDKRILDIFARSHKISKLSQSVIIVIVLLELAVSNRDLSNCEVMLNKALQELQMTWAAMQLEHDIAQKMPLTDGVISLYRKSALAYIEAVCAEIDSLPPLFPPNIDTLTTLKAEFGATVGLLELDLWDSSSSPQREVTQQLLHRLQGDLSEWVNEKLAGVAKHDAVKDAVIPEVTTVVEIVDTTSSHCSPLGVVRNFYNMLGINYYRVTSFAAEKKVSCRVKELMFEMDKYQKRYHSYAVNISASSRLTLRLYFAIRKFYSIIRDNISRREIYRLTICNYQSWFQESLVFWLQTFKSECCSRMEKAIDIDKDVVLVTTLVKFSTSSVDVLSCFAKITEEWRQIDFHDADSALMGVTKITDLICDGARLYADKIHSILKGNCYYDNEQGQFDVTDRLCITLNNIEHVRQYLTELPELLDWDTIFMRIATRYESEDVGTQAKSMLNRLIRTASSEIILKSSLLLQQITEKMKVDISRYMEIFTKKNPEKAASVDKLIGYLSSNLETLNDRLMSPIFPRMVEQLWNTVLGLFDQQLQVGQKPEYYRQMKQHLRSLMSYFVRGGMEEQTINTHYLESLKSRLELNCMSSEDLVLEYYHSLTSILSTPVDYYGHLAIKTAYMEETRGNITLFVKVIRASDVPKLDTAGLSDPYVEISIHPQTMFGHVKPQRTRVIDKTLNPVFNTTFQFPNIPKQYLSVRGTVILCSVMDHDKFTSDDFAGEVMLPLPSITEIGMDYTVDSQPVVMLPLRHPVKPTHGPFQVLRERTWDKSLKPFLSSRLKIMETKPEKSNSSNRMEGFFSFFTGLKTS